MARALDGGDPCPSLPPSAQIHSFAGLQRDCAWVCGARAGDLTQRLRVCQFEISSLRNGTLKPTRYPLNNVEGPGLQGAGHATVRRCPRCWEIKGGGEC